MAKHKSRALKIMGAHIDSRQPGGHVTVRFSTPRAPLTAAQLAARAASRSFGVSLERRDTIRQPYRKV